MRRLLHVRLPRDREREHRRVQREDVEQRAHAVLIQQHEADEHHAAGEQVSDVVAECPHRYKLRVTNIKSAPRSASINEAPRNSGTRKTRIFAMVVSNNASNAPATATFTT